MDELKDNIIKNELDDELKTILEIQEIEPVITPSNSMGLEPELVVEEVKEIQIEPTIEAQIVDTSKEELIQKDFAYARINLKEIIDTGKEAFENLASIASLSQHPRAYESLAVLMKNLSDSIRELTELHRTKKDLEKDTRPADKNITNNNLILTTSELINQLKALK